MSMKVLTGLSFLGSLLSTAPAFRLAEVEKHEHEPEALLEAHESAADEKTLKALCSAAATGNLEALETLLGSKPDILWACPEENGAPPALSALLHGHLAAAELLLSHGAALDSSNKDYTMLYKFYEEKAPTGFFGENPSTAIANTMAVFNAINSQKSDLIEDLMKKPVLVDALLDKQSIMTTAAKVGCLSCLKTLIEKCHINPDQENQDGETAIFLAQRSMKARCLIYLKDKCDMWHKDKGGLTVLESMQQPHYEDESDIPW